MKRTFDLLLAICCLFLFAFPICIVALLVKLTSKGPILYWSDRVGVNSEVFKMPKFRSMKTGTPALASHLLTNVSSTLTPIGSFLRKSSLDELPQIWCVITGDMSFVGPRPALYNQYDLIEFRSKEGIDSLLPGVTGWAQVNGRDEISISEKVLLDKEYLNKKSFFFDFRILWLTLTKVIKHDGVSH